MPKSRSLRASMAIRTGGILSGGRKLLLQLQIQPQRWHPLRMVLRVEGQLAAPIRRIHPLWCTRARAAAHMCNPGRGSEQHVPAPGAERGTEVDVLRVQKESLVEEPHRLRIP